MWRGLSIFTTYGTWKCFTRSETRPPTLQDFSHCRYQQKTASLPTPGPVLSGRSRFLMLGTWYANSVWVSSRQGINYFPAPFTTSKINVAFALQLFLQFSFKSLKIIYRRNINYAGKTAFHQVTWSYIYSQLFMTYCILLNNKSVFYAVCIYLYVHMYGEPGTRPILLIMTILRAFFFFFFCKSWHPYEGKFVWLLPHSLFLNQNKNIRIVPNQIFLPFAAC